MRAYQVASFMYDPLRPHGLQPARLLCPGESPGKRTGVGYHPLFQGMRKVRPGNSLVVQWLGLSTFNVMGMGSILGQRTNISEATRCDQKKKRKSEL